MANGKNEKDTEILDFEYIFPVDKMKITSTGCSNVFILMENGMSVANADWDNEMS